MMRTPLAATAVLMLSSTLSSQSWQISRHVDGYDQPRLTLKAVQPPTAGPGTPVVVLTERSEGLRLQQAGFRARSEFGGVMVFELPIMDWRSRAASALNVALVLDDGLFPSEITPDELAHAAELHRGLFEGIPLRGSNVLLAIYDSGIDWRHPELNDDRTSVAYIWDQTEPATPRFPPPPGQKLGRLYDRAVLHDAMQGRRSDVTTSDRTGHGTAIALVAHAVAPDADLVIIKGGDERFSEAGLVEALGFLDSLGTALQRPVVLNVSSGSHRGPHDGSRLHERAIDAFVSRSGRLVAVAAGNDGGRRIHAEGHLSTPKDSVVVGLTIPPYVATPGLANDLLDVEVWFSGSPGGSVTLEMPSGRRWTSSDSGMTFDVGDEGIVVLDRPNGARFVTVQLSDVAGTPPASGRYRLIIHGDSTCFNTDFHAWIVQGRAGGTMLQFDPDAEHVTSRSTVQSPANATGAVAVGAYEATSRSVTASAWTSVGPRVDGMNKPEVFAPGSVWLNSFARNFTGTSFSTPMVSAVACLLLQARPDATHEVLRDALADPSAPDMPMRTLDAARSLARLTGLRAFSSEYLRLRLVRSPAPTMQWSTSGLTAAERFTLLEADSHLPLAVWSGLPSAEEMSVALTADLFDRVAAGRAIMEVSDVRGRLLWFEPPANAGPTTVVPKALERPAEVTLSAYPNPFNATTTLTWYLPEAGHLEATVWSVDGREIDRLYDDAVPAGSFTVHWDRPVASGVYFVRSAYRPADRPSPAFGSTLRVVALK